MISENSTLKNQCRRDRLFQEKKHKELQLVHTVRADDSLTSDEKVAVLITVGHFGWERAQELVYGSVRYKKVYEQKAHEVIKDGRLR